MSQPPLRLSIAVGAVALLALAIYRAVAQQQAQLSGRQALLAGVLFGLTLATRIRPIHLVSGTKWSGDTAPVFAAALLLPASLAIPLAALAIATANAAQRRAWFVITLNAAEVAVRVGVGALVFHAVGGVQSPVGMPIGEWLAAGAITALAMYATNIALIEMILAVRRQRFDLRLFLRHRQLDATHEGALLLVGLVAVIIGADQPWMMFLLALPLIGVHLSLRSRPGLVAAHSSRAT